ncbi:hypothetical protein Rmf_16920 [Roseomonas fluvialis]|uniref:Class I SAM-dependent methyltransferase n=1 Tax=Roseomonas fluvialis TaxID=1750527 RepID=A0ABM7Y1T8_9PROT|nr:hypothetical protein Rmf_16920 [Roseomonas fluvialis]
MHILDASDPAALDAALGDAVFDIIIDDGSHRSEHVIATFGACFRRLAPRGIYIVEDLHASYWPDWGGRYRAPGSSIEFLKTLVDALHADHFAPWDTGIPEDERARLVVQGAEITRVTFHDSIAVIERGSDTRSAPYPPRLKRRRSRPGCDFTGPRGRIARGIGRHRRVLGPRGAG